MAQALWEGKAQGPGEGRTQEPGKRSDKGFCIVAVAEKTSFRVEENL